MTAPVPRVETSRVPGPARAGRILGAVAFAVVLAVSAGCGSDGSSLGDRARDAAERAGELSGVTDEFDDARDAVQDHLDAERALLDGADPDASDASGDASTGDTEAHRSRFCDAAARHADELADGVAVPDERRIEIYQDLHPDAPAEVRRQLDLAIEAARLNQTEPERVDAQRTTVELLDRIARTCD